jgi:hypothetical protein
MPILTTSTHLPNPVAYWDIFPPGNWLQATAYVYVHSHLGPFILHTKDV